MAVANVSVEPLRAALDRRGIVLDLARTTLGDDASWPGCESIVVYVEGDSKPIVDPVLDGAVLRDRDWVGLLVARIVATLNARRRERLLSRLGPLGVALSAVAASPLRETW